MSTELKQAAENYSINKDLADIFNEQTFGPKRVQILKWIKDLIDKPKHAHKEEEKLKGLEVEASLIAQIQNGNVEFRMKYFNSVLEEILNEFNQAKIKDGNIYVRSLTFKRWKERKVRLDETQKQFIIYSKKKQKTLSLTTYSVKWVGQKKDYQAFSLDSISSQNKYKQLLFGWVNFDGARIWHDSILRLMSQLPLNPTSIKDREAQSVQIQSSQSLFNNGMAQSMIHNTITLKSQDSQNQPQAKRKGSLQMNIQEEQLEKAEKPTESLQLNVQQKVNKKEETEKKAPVQKAVSSESESESPVLKSDKQTQKEVITIQTNVQVTQQQPEKSSNAQQTRSSDSSSPQIKKNIEATEKQQQEPVSSLPQSPQKNENISPQTKENTPKIVLHEASNQSQNQQEKQQQAVQPKEVNKQEIQQVEYNLEHLDDIKTPQAITEFLNEYKLETIADEREYKSISFNHGLRLLQSTEDPRKFKIFLAFQGVSSFELFNCISNVDDYNKWNSNVAETKVLNIMKNEQTAILYQKHKGIGIMYRPRDFVYLRHAFVKDQQYFIIDKSIEYDSLPNSISIVRGEIEHVVWCFKTHPQDEGRSLMIADFYYNNSGYSNKEQDASITFAYLNNFSNLSGFITQKSFQKSIAINMFDIIDQSQNKKSQIRSQDKDDKRNRQNLTDSLQHSQVSNQIGSTSPVTATKYLQVEQPNKEMTKIEENSDENQTSSANNINSKTSIEQIEDEEKRNIRIAYEQEEIQNAQLNNELNKFCEEIHQNDTTESNQEAQISTNTSQQLQIGEINIKKAGDKLAGMTINQMIEFVNKNKHWGVCVDQKYNMGRIETEPQFLKSDPEKGHFQYKKDWERCLKTGKFLFLNKEKIATQKKVISFLLSKIGSNILSGKSITSISLPIDIFEPRSNLERFAYSCSFAPIYLKRAAEITDPIEQMKNCTVYLLTTTMMYLDLEKPFNPILGETYQGRLDGYPFYCEQICHHPPICSYSYYTDSYKLTGSLESIAQMHANSVTGINQGNVTVKFHKTGNQVGLIQAPGSLNGTAFGTRYMSVDGKYIAYDLKNKLVMEVKVNPDKKGFFKSASNTIDYMAGGIYRVNDKFVYKFNSLKPHFYKFQGLNMKEDVVEQISTITGYWNLEMFIDDVKWFDVENPFPYKLEHEINPIPSDCNYRQDILYLKERNLKDGQIYKELLENNQRADRKLREKGQELRKKALKKQKK